MSDDNVYDLFGSADDDGDESEDTVENTTDPGTVAFMDQQSAEFNAAEHDFADRYGFVHKCKCDEDYASGNMVEVTECYANMTLEALDAAATLHAENKLLRTLIQQALGGAIVSALSDTEAAAEIAAGPEND